jgi:hypothetical protein
MPYGALLTGMRLGKVETAAHQLGLGYAKFRPKGRQKFHIDLLGARHGRVVVLTDEEPLTFLESSLSALRRSRNGQLHNATN